MHSFLKLREQRLIYMDMISAEDIPEWIWKSFLGLFHLLKESWWNTGERRDSCELFHFLNKL